MVITRSRRLLAILRGVLSMKLKALVVVCATVIAFGCAPPGIERDSSREPGHSLLLGALIQRLGSPDFSPGEGEVMYPFTYAFCKASGEEIVTNGSGFVLLRGPLWCLVQRWDDRVSGNPGRRMLIVDRTARKLEAEVREWPEGSRERWGNHWTCLRLADQGEDLYLCEYHFPEGAEQVLQSPGTRGFFVPARWNGDGLPEELPRFADASMVLSYEGPRVKHIEFRTGTTMITFMDFLYE
jgi:hypothetical protein